MMPSEPNKSRVDLSANELAESVFHRHRHELCRLLTAILRDHALAEDVLQTALCRLLETGGPERAESAKSWLFRVAVHEAMDVRRRQRTADSALETLTQIQRERRTGVPAPLVTLIEAETQERVNEQLETLSEPERTVVRARLTEGLRFQEIADREGIPLGTVLTRMRRALDRLRGKLDGTLPRE